MFLISKMGCSNEIALSFSILFTPCILSFGREQLTTAFIYMWIK